MVPVVMRSPSLSMTSAMCLPFTSVPFVEPKSATDHAAVDSRRISA